MALEDTHLVRSTMTSMSLSVSVPRRGWSRPRPAQTEVTAVKATADHRWWRTLPAQAAIEVLSLQLVRQRLRKAAHNSAAAMPHRVEGVLTAVDDRDGVHPWRLEVLAREEEDHDRTKAITRAELAEVRPGCAGSSMPSPRGAARSGSTVNQLEGAWLAVEALAAVGPLSYDLLGTKSTGNLDLYDPLTMQHPPRSSAVPR